MASRIVITDNALTVAADFMWRETGRDGSVETWVPAARELLESVVPVLVVEGSSGSSALGSLEGPGQARRADPDTSKGAARALGLGKANSQRRRVLAALVAAGPRGAIAEELSEATGIAYRTTTPRVGELARGGWAERIIGGAKRVGPRGSTQKVMVPTDAALREMGVDPATWRGGDQMGLL